MSMTMREESYDVVVLGGGASGISAALSAASEGARTLLVDAGPMVGGELLSGINLLGMLSSKGEWIVGGAARRFLDECDRLGGYIGVVRDYRPLHFVAFDPEIMKVAVSSVLAEAGGELRLYTFAGEVVTEDGYVTGVVLLNKAGRTLVRAKAFVDCSGDGDLSIAAGAPYESGDSSTGAFQSVTMVFRMVGVETGPLLDFMKAHPEHFAISEEAFRSIAPSRQEAIDGLHAQGLPKLALSGNGPLLSQAIDAGEMYATSIVAIVPVSMERKEVSINSTKVSNVDATDSKAISGTYATLLDQAMTCSRFLERRLPGFENARFSGLAPRIGIRETRRVMGDYVLTGDDVRSARKHADGIARGGHPIDVWVAGRGVHWNIVEGGDYYDIPFGALLPKGLRNVVVDGRCLSSTREGQSSARVMGTCLAMGQAAGTAAALAMNANTARYDLRSTDVQELRSRLKANGAIV